MSKGGISIAVIFITFLLSGINGCFGLKCVEDVNAFSGGWSLSFYVIVNVHSLFFFLGGAQAGRGTHHKQKLQGGEEDKSRLPVLPYVILDRDLGPYP